MFEDVFGVPESEDERRRRISRRNRRKGAAGEEIVRMNYGLRGYEWIPTGRGSDGYVVKRDLLGRVIDSRHIEVKTGGSQLSELQEETKRRNMGHYTVERLDPPPLFYEDPWDPWE